MKVSSRVKLEIATFVSKQPTLQVYGGFAREAMRAQLKCEDVLKTFEQVANPIFGSDVVKIIVAFVWHQRFDDLSWFENPKENVKDIDVMIRPATVQYVNGYVRSEVKVLRKALNRLLFEKYHFSSPKTIHGQGYDHEFDVMCRKKGECSHTAGDFHHWFISFMIGRKFAMDSEDFWHSRVDIDMIYMLKEDWLDASINGLIFEHNGEDYVFRSRKPSVISLQEIIDDIKSCRFHPFDLPEEMVNSDDFHPAYLKSLEWRWQEMERRGWKKIPEFSINK